MTVDERTGDDMVNPRIPQEYAELLDSILGPVSESVAVHVRSSSPHLIHAVAQRHENITADSCGDVVWLHDLSPNVDFVESPPSSTERVVICEPTDVETVRQVVRQIGVDTPCDCIVGNPYSFNQIEDRSLTAHCSPLRIWSALRELGYSVSVEGMHGPRSLVQSMIGKLWQFAGRLDRRDIHTHRMRLDFRETRLPFALVSCLVRFACSI